MPRTPSALRVLALDARLCPALSVSFTGGNLIVSGVPNATPAQQFLIRNTGGNKFQVLDNTTNYGTYAVTGDLRLNLTNYNTAINVNLNGGTLPGNASINLGTGNRSPATLTNTLTIYGGTVGGYVRVINGNGSETVSIGKPGGVTPVAIGSDLLLTGRAGGVAPGDVLFLNAGSVVGRDLIAGDVENVNVGEFGTAGGTVNRNVVQAAGQSTRPLALDIFGTVGGNATFTGTGSNAPAGDRVFVEGGAVVTGNLTAAFGNGVNVFQIFTDGVAGDGAVNGTVNVVMGSGLNPGPAVPANFLQNSGFVGGNFVATVGNGDSAFVFDGTVLGNVAYTSGNGTDDLGGGPFYNTFTAATGWTGTVGGNVALNLGNGANSFVLDATALVTGSRVSYTGGGGTDSVSIDGANTFILRVNLGAGIDTFAYGSAAATVGAATIDFGVDSDFDVYNPNGATVTWPQVLLNYP